MKKVRKNPRKGSVIEFAVLIMMVIFGLGLLLTGTGLIQTSQKQKIESDFQTRLQLDAIGEEFCQAVKSGDLSDYEENVDYVIDEEDTITFKHKEGALTIVLTLVNGNYTVTAWAYGK